MNRRQIDGAPTISGKSAYPTQRFTKLADTVGTPFATWVADEVAPRLQARRVRRRYADLRSRTPILASQERSLADLRDSHHGERCVIIGNGPSLRKTDVRLFKDEVTFGLNRVYLAFDEWGFDTTYHVAVNKYVAEQSGSELARVRSPLFTTLGNADHIGSRTTETYFLLNDRAPGFYGDVRFGLWEGATVTFVAMQLAYFMGFTEVVLVGVDHRFASTGPAHQLVESDSDDENHFDPRYFGPGYRWQLPDLETSEIAYSLARKAFENDGRRIVDATVDGALRVFPRVDLATHLA
ncbi:MAG: DUF115 domain-containing protein [Propionibacteriales bacterium]|nr:DUF115 domain-containing protein [Propionibacteriales bacterium]